MFAIARFQIPQDESETFHQELEVAHQTLALCEGYISGRVGRNTDEPGLLALITEWVNIGSYRRALSNYQVKISAVPILARAIDEPGGYIESDE
jgi:quinol monooxygenase YgiN